VSSSSLTPEQLHWSAGEQLEVEGDRPAARIGDVEVESLAERRARPRGDLPEAGDAGGNGEAVEVVAASSIVSVALAGRLTMIVAGAGVAASGFAGFLISSSGPLPPFLSSWWPS